MMEQKQLFFIGIVFPLIFGVNHVSNKSFGSPTLVQTKYGPVQGFYDKETDTNIWFGIPFAAPPIGDLRFKSPESPKSWSEPHDCRSRTQVCAQMRIAGFEFSGQEDCLYLDVYAPANLKSQDQLPVMTFIHGGAFIRGDSNQYDGRILAHNESVIVVAINYRLDVFGGLALDALQHENKDKSTGNYMLQDQRMALQWVHDNILAFNGDVSKTIIFGESAGAYSVCSHLVMPSSAGLFSAAVMESGGCDSSAFFFAVDQAKAFGEEYVTALGCGKETGKQLECLRKLPTRKLMNPIIDEILNKTALPYQPLMAPAFNFVPVIDGSQSGLPELPLTMLQKGNFNKVPTIMGTNKNEGSMFVPLVPFIVPNTSFTFTDEDVYLFLRHFVNKSTAVEALKMYPLSEFHDRNVERISAMIGDFFLVCPSRRASRALEKHRVPSFLYTFTLPIENELARMLGTYHGSELQFVFGKATNATNADVDHYVTKAFQHYWSNMARYGTPNHNVNDNSTVYLNWPKYDKTIDTYLNINNPLSLTKYLLKQRCDFWDTAPH